MIKRVLFTNILLSRLYFHLNVCFITHYHSKKKLLNWCAMLNASVYKKQ